jgi:F0F1-type ATP synthase membrane subunit c/vacuolar-type H+-ATPase subunit K
MTDLATTLTVEHAHRRPTRALLTLATGLLAGFVLGIIARAWMRLIAEDPEFTWNGTIFIVLAFTIFGLTQSVAVVVRRRARRRWTLTVARVLGAIGFMPLFVGAGAIMMPTVVGGGFARWRSDWRRLPRVICLVAAAGPVVIVGSQLVGSFGWSLHTFIGFVATLAIYGTIIAATKFTIGPQSDGWRLKRRIKISIFVIVGLLMTYALVGVVG